MKELKKYADAFKRLPQEIERAEAEWEYTECFSLTRTDGSDCGGQYAEVNELFVRAGGQKTGMIYTQKADEDPASAIRAAYENSLYSAEEGAQPMNGAEMSAEYADGKRPEVSEEEIRECMEKIDRGISRCSGRLLNRSLTLSRYVERKEIVNTCGLDAEAEHCFYEAEVGVTADLNGLTSVEFEVSAENLTDISPEEIRRITEKKLSEHLPVVGLNSGTYPCLLDACVVCNIFIMGWRLFSGKACCENTSPLKGKEGKRIFSAALNITDGTGSPYSGYRTYMDCEGSPGKAVDLVRDGILTGFMHNLSSAEKTGSQPTGNGGRKQMISGSVQTDTVVVPKNFMMLPGEETTEQLISSMERGVFINQSFDMFHTLNLTSGDFAIPCEGIIVENGKKTGRAVGLNMEGNLLKVLESVTKAGSEMFTFAMPIIKSFAVSAPSLMVPSLKISVQ